MFFPQEILVIFKFLDYLDSEVIKELHFPLSLGSLTTKGATRPLPPTSQGVPEITSPWALRDSA